MRMNRARKILGISETAPILAARLGLGDGKEGARLPN